MLKINFLGDSITEGALASQPDKCYVELVGKMLPAKVHNYGISATRIAKQIIPSIDPIWDKYFASRVKNMDQDADYVFVFGGTNDYGHGDAPLGKMGDKTPETFYGAMDDLINELLKYYQKDKITFIIPIYRLNEDNIYGDGSKKEPCHPLAIYRQAMVEELNKYQINILDIKDIIGKAENNPLLADGLHPNNAGHKLIAELICNYIRH